MGIFMSSGNKTYLYPIEISPLLLNLVEGHEIKAFSIGVSVGNAVVMASHLFVSAGISNNLWSLCPDSFAYSGFPNTKGLNRDHR